jgi:hypothetical protein
MYAAAAAAAVFLGFRVWRRWQLEVEEDSASKHNQKSELMERGYALYLYLTLTLTSRLF